MTGCFINCFYFWLFILTTKKSVIATKKKTLKRLLNIFKSLIISNVTLQLAKLFATCNFTFNVQIDKWNTVQSSTQAQLLISGEL